MVCGKKGLGEVEEEEERNLILGGVGNLVMENFHGNGCKEWKKNVCTFVCDFNGGWLKYSSLLWCIVILLSEEGRVVNNIQVGCFIKLVVMFFF